MTSRSPPAIPRCCIVATDRISAFDYVLGSGIPDKGKVLTQLSGFWFERMGDLVPHHLIALDVDAVSRPRAAARRRAPRPHDAGAAHRADPDRVRGARIPVGFGLEGLPADRQGLRRQLPAGLRESDRLPEPIFTPATKAETGHDVNISEDEAAGSSARDLDRAAESADPRDLSPRLRARRVEGHHHRRHQVRVRPGRRGTRDRRRPHRRSADARLVALLAAAAVRARPGQPSFDKQFVRDYLEEIRWNKQPPVPSLPDDVVRRTREKYVEAFRLLSGRELR